MKKLSPITRRKIGIILVLLPLVLTFVYVGVRSGPLAPVSVTTIKVDIEEISPSLFGIGTVEARYSHKIGPTTAGRIKNLSVDVGDTVQAGQLLGEMDSVDLESRSSSQSANIRRAEALLKQSEATYGYARDEAKRAEKLFPAGAVSKSLLDAKRQELRVAETAWMAAKEDLTRTKSDYDAIANQLDNAQLIAPIDGIVVLRNAEIGTTVVAGQTIYEIIDPKSIWINARFDQISSSGLEKGLSAQIVLRSRNGESLIGHILYVEPKADSVTEETLAKVIFDTIPNPLPPLGELAEVTVELPTLPPSPTIPNASIQNVNGKTGVWEIKDVNLSFVPVTLGSADLDGQVQVKNGLKGGENIILYSEKLLSHLSRIRIVDKIHKAEP
ncbi:efflux RND transporter periplasmic adaptor subunit [Bacteroides sp.]|uniref:efflux RND transporter periplasmic adaptor subunit n=1 Tax=Bacteroides sp. TaxID=29523 RepID=UPI0026188309|nr:efflux RND transporter periplasmic adaptor subunit [Bacteroides sp.]MDD3040671.1 efflux RND transporter periplasmic adaptor subunit [Bacteroides sp.]